MVDITIRELEEKDLFNGFLESMDSLKLASNLDIEKAKEIFEKISSNSNHFIYVAILDGRVVGSTSMLIEPKFIHNGRNVAHIEDVVVSKDYQGKGIGEMLMRTLLDLAKDNNCYKTILDCTDEVKPFYEKIGFKIISNGMRYDHS
ncbi:MAG: GNAT family N-acetyltransferase [Nitrososphaerota archaeon]|jgi:glucosamine-phosphate N-acetyltransferase|nr:GNAT family N-acetyltransferase [Nitrososphaerota archaeon]MDG7054247.1 GNAT family N-acetyltransferase [Nitrososphaerota archaeon]